MVGYTSLRCTRVHRMCRATGVTMVSLATDEARHNLMGEK